MVTSHRVNVIVVLDAWEVRVVVASRRTARLRRVLLQERPALVVSPRPPLWLKRMRVQVETRAVSEQRPSTRSFPELRRFAGSRHDTAIHDAVSLAHDALINLAL